MQKVVSAAEMREIDRLTSERYGIPSLILMESAATASAKVIAARFNHDLAGRKALILCGPGNNGGDGAALARHLLLAGARPRIVLFGRVEDTKGDARTNFEIARRLAGIEGISGEVDAALCFAECDSERSWQRIADYKQSYDVIVDAMFGTGLTRPLEGVYVRAIEHLTELRLVRDAACSSLPLIISLDIPSGLNADLAGAIGEAVHSDLTITFTAPKPANALPPASLFGGQFFVAHIGSPAALTDAAASQLHVAEDADARRWLEATRYTPGSYKNTHGHALVIAGSRRMSGAAVLCAEAAMRAGAGLTTVASSSSAINSIASRLMPEVMSFDLPETDGGAINSEAIEGAMNLMRRATVVAVGPGLSSEEEETRRFVRDVIERRTTPIVIDADGLNALSPWPDDLRGSEEAPLVLTPHEGEMLRLLGTSERAALADRVGVLREFAVKHSLIVVLKGTRTLIAAPDGRVIVNPTGNAGLGTAGAGDTLTGIITGFLAQSYGTLKDRADALSAVVAAVYVGGLAGDIAARERGMRTLVASDIREYVGAAVRQLDPQGERP
ncbi:MAG TPA: NAD(P)H-hydrate dehydratase [Pyrinomonadaceae bacterium]|nr:NAD(P)H-hydrate dehydratase [Pyrinomonadaceae bacterium]